MATNTTIRKGYEQWCINAKHAMVDKKMSVNALAAGLGMNRSYVSTILNSHDSKTGTKKISDFLGIADVEC